MKDLFWRVLIIVTMAAIILVMLAITWNMHRAERRLIIYLFVPVFALLVRLWKKI